MIDFIVPGPPKGKGRHRTRIVQPKDGGHAFAMNYSDEETKKYENLVTLSFRQIHCGNPLECAIKVTIAAYFHIPKSTTKRLQARMASDDYPVVKKPDIDNISKVILDGLNGVAFKDDSQIFDMRCVKFYSLNPRVRVIIEEYHPIQF
jgi:Holliday junction resolvase RusA-like endonuclease